MKWKADRAERK